jgi:hypothetical protein
VIPNKSYALKQYPPREVLLKCKICGEYKIPWPAGALGCPPEYCRECRKEHSYLFNRRWTKW